MVIFWHAIIPKYYIAVAYDSSEGLLYLASSQSDEEMIRNHFSEKSHEGLESYFEQSIETERLKPEKLPSI